MPARLPANDDDAVMAVAAMKEYTEISLALMELAHDNRTGALGQLHQLGYRPDSAFITAASEGDTQALSNFISAPMYIPTSESWGIAFEAAAAANKVEALKVLRPGIRTMEPMEYAAVAAARRGASDAMTYLAGEITKDWKVEGSAAQSPKHYEALTSAFDNAVQFKRRDTALIALHALQSTTMQPPPKP